MALNEWLANNGNLTDTTNWSLAAIPVNDDIVLFDKHYNTISTNLNGLDAVTGLDIRVTPNWAGKFTDHMHVSTGTTLDFNGPRCQAFYLDTAGGDASIRATSAEPNACNLTGTLTSCTVKAAQMLTLDAALTLTNLRGLSPAIKCTLESGLTLTNAYIKGGVYECYAALTTLLLKGGSWDHQGDVTFDIGTLTQDAGAFYWSAPGSTITLADVYGGLFDATKDPKTKTITNGSCWTYGRMLLDNGFDTIVTTNNLKQYGGYIHGGAAIGMDVEMPPIGPS